MRDEIVGITKFHRTTKGWVCNECDSENPEVSGSCILCGSSKTADARIFGPGIPEGNLITEKSSVTDENNNYDNSSKDGFKAEKEKFNWLPVLVIIVIFMIIAMAYASSLKAEKPEHLYTYAEEVQEITQAVNIPEYDIPTL